MLSEKDVKVEAMFHNVCGFKYVIKHLLVSSVHKIDALIKFIKQLFVSSVHAVLAITKVSHISSYDIG